MSDLSLRQTAGAGTARTGAHTGTVNLTDATLPGSLVVVVASTMHRRSGYYPMLGPSGFTLAFTRTQDELTTAVWYRAACPSLTSVSVTATGRTAAEKTSIPLRIEVLEYRGAAQTSVLDRIAVSGDSSYFGSGSNNPRSGSTATSTTADTVVIGIIANEHASTLQSGFTGGLTRLSDQTSPSSVTGASSARDEDRLRLTVHQRIVSSTGQFAIGARMGINRDWIAGVLVFKAGVSGPARMSSTMAPALIVTDGRGDLSAFGPLRSLTSATPVTSGVGVQARVGPYSWQYRLGGFNGLLIGDDTPYEVESVDGLEGWEMRTSDVEFPRGDGTLRGVDLQSSRQVLFKLKMGGNQREVEDLLDTLYRALVPQRDNDWELIWRYPNRPLRMIRCRPVSMLRELTWVQTLIQNQAFTLLAADPRHYSAFVRNARLVPQVTDIPITTSVINQGNGAAYPLVRISGPTSGPPVTRVELVNSTYDVVFVAQANLPTGSTLVGDFEARATGAPRSVVTIDGQSKYGAWAFPRDTFRLGPGENKLYLRTTPQNAPGVRCTLDYRDTWSG